IATVRRMQRLPLFALCAALTACAVDPDDTSQDEAAVTNTINGWIDRADQTSVVGWACVTGDASTKVPVDLWGNNGFQWSFLGSVTADRLRPDVGASGQCGAGTASTFHGFEFTIFPDVVLRHTPSSSYQVYAYVHDGASYRPINNTPT